MKTWQIRVLPREFGKESTFCRGGYRWSSVPVVVSVTPELEAVLRAESMLAVEEPPAGYSGDPEVRDLVDTRAFYNHLHNAGAADRAERAALLEQKAQLKARAELEALRAEVEALKSGKTPEAKAELDPKKPDAKK